MIVVVVTEVVDEVRRCGSVGIERCGLVVVGMVGSLSRMVKW